MLQVHNILYRPYTPTQESNNKNIMVLSFYFISHEDKFDNLFGQFGQFILNNGHAVDRPI